MHSTSSLMLSALVMLSALATSACSGPEKAAEDAVAARSESELSAGGSECVLDTLFLKKGFLADLSASVDPSFVKDYGPEYYKHIEIPKTLDAALPPTAEYGESLYTIVGFDFHPEELAPGSTARPKNVATITGGPVADPKLVFARARSAAARSLFDALTRATEVTENHVVPPQHVYDRSSTRVSRTSPAGRIACSRTTYPGSPKEVVYSCTLSEVERNMVQTFNSKDAHCPTR